MGTRAAGRGWAGRGVSAGVAVGLLAGALAGAGTAARAAAAGHLAAADTISTVAGGVGGPAKATRVALPSPCGVTFAAGSLYIADGGAVRKVSSGSDELTTPAGTGISPGDPLGDGGLGSAAALNDACGVAVDGAGNLVIADTRHERVRVVASVTGTFYGRAMTAGHIYTVAGDGKRGFSGGGGPASQAELHGPGGVTVDGAGNLVIADSGNNRVRVVAVKTGSFYGQAMTAGNIYTVAGNGRVGFSGDGGRANRAELGHPEGVSVDGAGNLVIADSENARLRVVAVKTGSFYGQAMTAGNIYTVAGDGKYGFSGDGGPATAAELYQPNGMSVDSSGNLVIADSFNHRVRVVAVKTGSFYGQAMTAGNIYTVAGDGKTGYSGDGGPATSAKLNTPDGVSVDSSGNLVIADNGNYRVRVVAVETGTFYGQAMTAGNIYTVAGDGSYSYSGNGGPATSAEMFLPGGGVAVDSAGNLITTDDGNNRVRVVAAATGSFYGQAMTAGNIYTVAGGGQAGLGDGGPATAARLGQPGGVALDGAGNLVIGDYRDNRVRVVAVKTGSFYGQAMTAGDIYTVAGNGTEGYSGDGGPATGAEIDFLGGVAVDGAGNLVIADAYNNRVRVVAVKTGSFYGQAMTAGNIYTVAGDATGGFSGDGGPATSAELNFPTGLAVDGAGNLVIADNGNFRVRVVAVKTGSFYGQAMTAGDIYTVAGDGQFTYSGDGGPATSAGVAGPQDLAVDGAGNLIIADNVDDRVRVVAVKTGSFYGQAMTAEDIYTVAGDGTSGFSGDGGPATSAELTAPAGVAVDGAGNLIIGDQSNFRIREVTG